MTTHELNIRLALSAVPGWNIDDVTLKKVLAESITSVTYLIEKLNKAYVLRVDKPFIHGISPNRENESIIRRALSRNNFAAKLVHSSPSKGILLTEYIAGTTWQEKDIHKQAKLIRLAYKLKKLHALTVQAENFDLLGGIHAYINELGTEQARKWGEKAKALLSECSQRPFALCHNDLHANNIIEGKELYFIDWEYAGLGNPLFDVATIFQHHQLTAEQRQVFLDNYLDEYTEADENDIKKYMQIYDLLLALWLSMLVKSIDLDAQQTSLTLEQLQTVKLRIDANT